MKIIYASGKHSDKQIMVSDCDYEVLSKIKWYIVAGYACGYVNSRMVKMHRVILGAKDGEISDHIDRVKLNNQRENLRIVTHAENIHNRECGRKIRKRNYTGVQKSHRTNAYYAVVSRGGKESRSELYSTELAAAIKYNRMLIENNFDGVPNAISLTEQEQNEILLSDSRKLKRIGMQSGVPGITFHTGNRIWVYRKTMNGKRVCLGTRRAYSDIIKLYNSSSHLTCERPIPHQP